MNTAIIIMNAAIVLFMYLFLPEMPKPVKEKNQLPTQRWYRELSLKENMRVIDVDLAF